MSVSSIDCCCCSKCLLKDAVTTSVDDMVCDTSRLCFCNDNTHKQNAYNNNSNKTMPKSFGKSASLSPHRKMHSPTACVSVCALACTMRNEALWDITGHYETLRKHCASLWDVTEHYRALWDIIEHYGSVTGCCGMLRNITERYGSFADRYEMLCEHYRALTESNRKHRFCHQ